jgi:hypothetical protein
MRRCITNTRCRICRYKRVIAFLPDFYLDYDYVANKKRLVRAGFEVNAFTLYILLNPLNL